MELEKSSGFSTIISQGVPKVTRVTNILSESIVALKGLANLFEKEHADGFKITSGL